MNATIEKFGYPATVIREFDHWLVLLRPTQVTLGSLVLAAKSDATAYADLPGEAFAEQKDVVFAVERMLARFTRYERINYLMLMLVDPHVHFHVIPRYSAPRSWHGLEFVDRGWPGPPRLDQPTLLTSAQISSMGKEISAAFR